MLDPPGTPCCKLSSTVILLGSTNVASVPFTNIPFQQNTEFIGQVQILNELKSILEDASVDRQVALYGLGGIGCVAQELQTSFTHYT